MNRPMDTDRALRHGAAVMMGLALIAVVGFWTGWALIADGVVLPGWAVAVVALIVVAVLRLFARRARRLVCRTRTERARTVGFTAVELTMLWCSGLGAALALTGHVVFSKSFTPLTPRAPGGCLLVAEESSFLFAGSGDLWFSQSSWGLAHRVASYAADDGARPFTDASTHLAGQAAGPPSLSATTR